MRLLSHGALVVFAAMSALLCAIADRRQGHVPLLDILLAAPSSRSALFAFMGTNFNALAMDPLGHVAGTASSVDELAADHPRRRARRDHRAQAYDGTVLPLSLGFSSCRCSASAIIVLTERNRLFGRLDAKAAHPPASH